MYKMFKQHSEDKFLFFLFTINYPFFLEKRDQAIPSEHYITYNNIEPFKHLIPKKKLLSSYFALFFLSIN